MAFIDTIPIQESTGDVHAMYAASQTPLGYVPNYARLFSHRPGVMAAWSNLLKNVRASMDTRRYELATIAAAHTLRSSYCMLAHGSILRRDFYSEEATARIAHDYATADLPPIDVEVMRFAEHVARDASSITASDVQRLRDQGLSDAEIFDVAATAAARCFFSKLLDALGAEPDSSFLALGDGLRSELTVGRGISDAPVEVIAP